MSPKKANAYKEDTVKKKATSSKKIALKPVKASPQEPSKETPKAKHIGEVLKVVRESKSTSIQDISSTLRISEIYLRAIESMDSDALPEQVYTLGFVRSYAHYLGIDPQKSVTQFKTEIFAATTDIKKLSIPKPVEPKALPTKKILWASAISLLLLLSATYVYWGQSTSSVDEEINALLAPKESALPLKAPLIEPRFGQTSPQNTSSAHEPESSLDLPNL